LDECVRRTEDLGLKNFEPIHIPAPYPEEVLKQIDSVDFFLSTAVYQHLPGRSYARRVTDIAMRLLADDGLALINIRYSNLKRQNRNWRRSYKKTCRFFQSLHRMGIPAGNGRVRDGGHGNSYATAYTACLFFSSQISSLIVFIVN
tara:strand:+ start:179 stop:616 length:438 start_codon:yes stop_codon:yes gene_type:complete